MRNFKLIIAEGIRQIFNLMGYDVILKSISNKKKDETDSFYNSILNNNFKEICNAYEYCFSKFFGEITQNPERLNILKRLSGTGPAEAYFIIYYLEKTKYLNGDICEFGIAQGETSSLLASEIKSTTKKLHLFDSFEGLPKPTEKDILKNDIFRLGKIEAYEGTMKCSENLVIERLKQMLFPEERYFIHKGFIENLISTKNDFPDKVSFAYIDFDFYEPTIITLNYLDSVMEQNSVIIIDDYDSFSTGTKSAVDEFLSEKNKNILNYEIIIPEKVFGCFAILAKRT